MIPKDASVEGEGLRPLPRKGKQRSWTVVFNTCQTLPKDGKRPVYKFSVYLYLDEGEMLASADWWDGFVFRARKCVCHSA